MNQQILALRTEKDVIIFQRSFRHHTSFIVTPASVLRSRDIEPNAPARVAVERHGFKPREQDRAPYRTI
jgi:hypothetical protein